MYLVYVRVYMCVCVCVFVVQLLSHVWLCDPMDCSMPGFPVHHQFPELAQTHVHWVGDAIQSSCYLSSPSSPAFSLSQHQGFSLMTWLFASGGQSIGAFSFLISPSSDVCDIYMHMCVLGCFSCDHLFVTSWTVACLARILEWVAMPPPGDDPGMEPASLMSPAFAGGFFTTSTTWKSYVCVCVCM